MIKDFTTSLSEKEQLTSNVWRFLFSLEEGDTLDFFPGQYMLIKVDGFYRQYSISSSPLVKNQFEMIIEIIPNGLASVFLAQLQVGQKAYFKGPAGVFVLKETPKDKIFLATGTGIAPIKAMIAYSLMSKSHDSQLHLFFGVKNRLNMYLYNEFKHLSDEYKQFHFYMCLSQEESFDGLNEEHFRKGRVTAHLNTESIPAWSQETVNNFEYYICGSRPVVDSLREFVASLHVNPENIFFERFTL